MAAAAAPRNTAPFLEAAGGCATPAFEAALNTETTVVTMQMRVVKKVIIFIRFFTIDTCTRGFIYEIAFSK